MNIEKTFKFEVKDKDEPKEMTWNEAMAKFKDNKEGWRLPTIEELNLMYHEKDNLKMKSHVYWSSSEIHYYFARIQYFYDGFQGWNYKGSNSRVRCVRDIK